MDQTAAKPERAKTEPASQAPPAFTPEPKDFDNLVREQSERVTRLCYRLLGWRADVEDVVQDVFYAALRAWPRFRGASAPATWLTRIAVNACRGHLRKRWLRLRYFTAAEETPEAVQEAGRNEPLLAAERFEQVRAAVRRLPAKYREAVVLRYLEGMPVEQVSDVLGLSRGAMDVRLNRARKMLHEDLAEYLEG